MKITAEKAKEREAFAADVFRKNYDEKTGKTMSVPKANKEVHKKYGSAINAQNMYAIRAKTIEDIVASQKAAPPPAAEPVIPPKLMRRDQRDRRPLVVVELRKGETPAQLLGRALDEMAQQGMTGGRVDAERPDYVVIKG